MLTTFSATKRTSVSHLKNVGHPSGRARSVRLLLVLLLATVLVSAWLVWRYWFNPTWINELPQGIVEPINVVTISAAATVGLLWSIVAYQRWRTLSAGPMITNVAILQALSPAEFEQFAAELFRSRGYSVEVRGRSGDLGVDLEIVNGTGKRAIAQCKRYRSSVGPDVVRELYGTMIHERVSHAFLVTTAEVSDGARAWAAGKPITLIDGETLLGLANDAHFAVG